MTIESGQVERFLVIKQSANDHPTTVLAGGRFQGVRPHMFLRRISPRGFWLEAIEQHPAWRRIRVERTAHA
jgi:hypothetical protein